MDRVTMRFWRQSRPIISKHGYFTPSQPLPHARISWKDTVPFVPPVSSGVCIKVCDGDTIVVAAKLALPNSPLYRFYVRLAGVHCPELEGATAEETKLALLAKQEVEKHLLNRDVQLLDVNTETYGRLLAQVYCTDLSTGKRLHINSLLLDKGLAAPFFDGAKSKRRDLYWEKKYHLQLLKSDLWKENAYNA